jgi:hypothetical protein
LREEIKREMSDFWDSRYLISLVKEEVQSSSIEVDEAIHFPKEEGQYFLRITSQSGEKYPSSLDSGQAKIFVIKSGLENIYVGYASESMLTRLSQGLTDSFGKYFVKEGEFESEELDLFIFEFPLLVDNTKTETRNYYQSIQSELIYLIKSETGKWPTLQKQINVSNLNAEEAGEIAREMFEKVK